MTEQDKAVLLSLVLLVVGIWLQRRSAPRPVYTAAVVLAAAASIFLYAAHFVSDYFTAEGINEAVIYHLRYGVQGAGFAEYAGLVAGVLAGAVLGMAALFWLLRKPSAQRGGAYASYGNPAALLCVCLSIALQPAAAAVYRLLPAASVSQAAAGASENGTLHAEFGKYYAVPKAARSARPARNLVFIYAESLERTYFDESLFPGLIKELRELEGKAI